MAFDSIRPREAYERMQHGWTYLDVRSEQEFAAGHAKGAINIPQMHKALLGLKANP
ncbi:MAG: rhodanese-like domain-containing protein, partial [Deltaproteobacteria bacterium]|nr:rhodanese-like domain-containing protein [Deltaproteobacteria bacterium]